MLHKIRASTLPVGMLVRRPSWLCSGCAFRHGQGLRFAWRIAAESPQAL